MSEPKIDNIIHDAAAKFVLALIQLATGQYLRAGILMEGVSEVVCQLYAAFPGQRSKLDDILEELLDEVRKASDPDSPTMPVVAS